MKTAHIDIRIDPELLARIDEWLDSKPIPPTRSEAIRRMIEMFLDREEDEPR